jgi:cellulose synthase/poly-beta-1,6-N-acetylglucosamine synthase-like glycosyltransferase
MTIANDAQSLLFFILLVNALACFFLLGLQTSTVYSRSTFGRLGERSPSSVETLESGSQIQESKPNQDARKTFFSIHVPTHNEPPNLVIETLESLSRLNWHDFEVLLIDNNTAVPQIWMPVQHACERINAQMAARYPDRSGPCFRFYHFENVEGAKAGALNLAAELACNEATHFAIVDADYQVKPDFLSIASQAIHDTGADFVQFPQSYRDQHRSPSVTAELADYFLSVAPYTNRSQAMLLTGTLSVIDREAITSVGGWSGRTITEDAELGVRLFLAQRRGVYVDQVVGRGVLPLDFHGLAKQRDRWVAGNVQTLIAALKAGLLPSSPAAVAIWTQLTAWISLCALPASALVLTSLMPSDHLMTEPTASLAGLTICLSIFLATIRLRATEQVNQPKLVDWLRICRVKLALFWTASLAWVPALFGAKLKFVRTRKAPGNEANHPMRALGILSFAFAGVGIIHLAKGQHVAAIACLLLALCWVAARSVDRELTTKASMTQNGGAPWNA